MKKTPLHSRHIECGAKMAPFGGYEMPIQYRKGIIFEHTATRSAATVFDTCHMGEFEFSGPSALSDLEMILSCPVATLPVGQCRYGFICNDEGGIIDDQIIYRRADSDFFMVVNASTEEKDFSWITAHCSPDTAARNVSAETGKIDLQGPNSAKICLALFDNSVIDLKYYHFMNNSCRGESVLVSRTGYTGEIGFEFYASIPCIQTLWDECIRLGAEPAGLGARDTLRLEMGFPLYGHELDEATDASWSGFTRAIGDKPFIGSAALSRRPGTQYRLSALLLTGRRTVHPGNPVLSSDGKKIGRITSGSFSPSVGCAIALGYLQPEYGAAGTMVSVDTGRGVLAAQVTTTPFYRKATARASLAAFL